MAGLFSKPKIQVAAPVAPPPSPISDDAATKAATNEKLEQAAKAERGIRGRAATLLTSGVGVTDEAPISKRVLLGA
jgi:hypothetical protein